MRWRADAYSGDVIRADGRPHHLITLNSNNVQLLDKPEGFSKLSGKVKLKM